MNTLKIVNARVCLESKGGFDFTVNKFDIAGLHFKLVFDLANVHGVRVFEALVPRTNKKIEIRKQRPGKDSTFDVFVSLLLRNGEYWSLPYEYIDEDETNVSKSDLECAIRKVMAGA